MPSGANYKSAQAIYSEMKAKIDSSGRDYSSWYAGVTSDIPGRLFGFHQVPRVNHWFIWREVSSDTDARAVEAALHNLGCQGDVGGGDHAAIYVYAYLITDATME